MAGPRCVGCSQCHHHLFDPMLTKTWDRVIYNSENCPKIAAKIGLTSVSDSKPGKKKDDLVNVIGCVSI